MWSSTLCVVTEQLIFETGPLLRSRLAERRCSGDGDSNFIGIDTVYALGVKNRLEG